MRYLFKLSKAVVNGELSLFTDAPGGLLAGSLLHRLLCFHTYKAIFFS